MSPGSFPFPSSPEILAERARAVIQKAGYPDPPLDSTQGFSYHGEYIYYLSAQDPSPTMYAPLSTDEQGAVRFWYRQSPHYLVPHRVTPGQFFPRDFDPPASVPGMVQVQLDIEGRLRRFEAVPPEFEEPGDIAPVPDWTPLLRQAWIRASFLRWGLPGIPMPLPTGESRGRGRIRTPTCPFASRQPPTAEGPSLFASPSPGLPGPWLKPPYQALGEDFRRHSDDVGELHTPLREHPCPRLPGASRPSQPPLETQ